MARHLYRTGMGPLTIFFYLEGVAWKTREKRRVEFSRNDSLWEWTKNCEMYNVFLLSYTERFSGAVRLGCITILLPLGILAWNNVLNCVADPDPFYTDLDRAFHFDTDPDPCHFKEVMYLKRYFLYFFTWFSLSVGQTGPTQKVFFVKFSFQLFLLCSLEKLMDPDPQHPLKHTTALKELFHQIKFAQRLGATLDFLQCLNSPLIF